VKNINPGFHELIRGVLPKYGNELAENTFSVLSNGTLQSLIISNILTTPSFNHKAIFWLTKDAGQSETIFHILNYWTKAFDNNTHTVFIWDNQNETEKTKILWAILSHQPIIVLCSISGLEEIVAEPKDFQNHLINIEKNSSIAMTNLAKRLVSLGYVKENFASTPLMFSQKGGVFNIYSPQYDLPIRLDFSGETVEKICFYDLKNKKNTAETESVVILGNYPVSRFEHSILEYLPEHGAMNVVWSDPDELEDFSYDWKKIQRRLNLFPRVIFESFPRGDEDMSMDIKSAPLFHHNWNKFVDEIKSLTSQKFSIFIATAKAVEFENVIKKSGLTKKNITFMPAAPPALEGYILPSARIAYITDQEVFGYTPDEKQAKSAAIDHKFLLEMKAGDIIVHVDHGIARFRGMVKKEIESMLREFFYLEYDYGDKLFVPIYQAEKLNKYIGKQNPPLHRLGSGNWKEMCTKIKKDSLKLARELLETSTIRTQSETIPLAMETKEEKKLANSFEFEITDDQQRSIEEINHDLARNVPMDRLVCGDVGFGKTEVAIRAAFKTVMNGMQVALLSPTTILTQQHYDTFKERLESFGINIALLSRLKTPKEQKQIIEQLSNNQIDIVIGTHRLLSKDINFKNLGLIIVDEEQRFGVEHKEKLKRLKKNVHILTLTATPIPRTLNFALSGLKDISTIETPPPGRLPIETIIRPSQDELIISAIQSELKRNGQVYFLHNQVETIEAKAKQIRQLVPKAKVGIIHGQLEEHAMMAVMENFDNREIDVLVSTTIIENGLDLPNANTLIVEDATNFGLSQLYQLRGRIGRADRQAFAYFLYKSKQLTPDAKKRLIALLEAKELGSGFQLALRDLEIRGTGNLLGKQQHGRINAIGLNLYLNLLQQSAEEIKTGKISEPIRDVTIDLPLPALIPTSMEPREEKRLHWYQKLSAAHDIKELKKLANQFSLMDKAPEEYRNLIALLEIKVLAQKSSVISIDTTYVTDPEGIARKRIVFKFAKSLVPKQIEQLFAISDQWFLSEYTVKIDLDALAKDWLKDIKKCVSIL
jgi:transcription-repair coupling factor (superfamily II helicase)